MSTSANDLPRLESGRPQATAVASTWVRRLLTWEAFALLAAAQVLIAGYQLGVGNQTIQVPMMFHSANPSLYANDPLIATANDYPSFFFTLLSPIVRASGLENAYLALHLLTGFAVLLFAFRLGRSAMNSGAAGLVLVVMLLAGHHRALGGDELYSLGFTHTWAVFPLAIAAMVLVFEDRLIWAAVLTGIIFNLHALTAAYLLAMFGLWALVQWRQIGLRKLLLLSGLFLLIAAPTLLTMLLHAQSFDEQWVRLTRIRSADHSLPTSWWVSGSPDIPRFAMLVALAALSMSFRYAKRQQLKSELFLAAAAGLFELGYIFAEIWSWPAIMRLQPFRASRLVLVLLMLHIAWGIVSSWAVFRSKQMPAWRRWLELISAGAVLAVVAVPQLLPMLPYALVLATAVALINGRLSWLQAALISAAMLIVLAAVHSIHFVVPGLEGAAALKATWSSSFLLATIAIVIAAGLLAIQAKLTANLDRRLGEMVWIWLSAMVPLMLLAVVTWTVRNSTARALDADPWVNLQRWARDHTARDALFLTPAEQSGFRLHSLRSAVGEWRDGTQMYFTAGYAQNWWGRMNDLRPGLFYDQQGRRRLLAGKLLKDLPDAQLIDLARKYGAGFIVLPAGTRCDLTQAYANANWAVYLPESAKPRGVDMPPDVTNPDLWREQDRFIREVALPNIEKYRKGDVRIDIVDPAGRPIRDGIYELRQTRQSFGFGCSLPFFAPVEGTIKGDFKPPLVTPKQLDRFLEIFNYSVIPFSGKWGYVEFEEGKRQYHDLDNYVDWCVKHDVTVEFHYLSGLLPEWFPAKEKGVGSKLNDEQIALQQKLFLDHSMDLVKRYGDRVKIWQVCNDAWLVRSTPKVFEEIRKLYPDAMLGIAECTWFWSPDPPDRADIALYRGMHEVEFLQKNGVKLDYFAPHGHSPHGVWPDANQMYKCFDTFAEHRLKIRVTEAMVPMSRIVGPIRNGNWTEELRADFLSRYFTICFSHPAVDAVNYWFLAQKTAPRGAGLLDENDDPTPAFNALKKLIREGWMTRTSGGFVGGTIAARGFHGDYELTVRSPTGRKATAAISIRPGEENHYRVIFDEQRGTMAVDNR